MSLSTVNSSNDNENSDSPPKKKTHTKRNLDDYLKSIVLNIYKSELANPVLQLEKYDVVELVARKTGMSKTTVYNIVEESKNCQDKILRYQRWSVAAKTVILNFYRAEVATYPTLRQTYILDLVASKTGVYRQTIYKIVKEYEMSGGFSPPKLKRYSRNPKSIFDLIEDFHKTAIRRKIHEFYFRNELPTVWKILAAVNDDPDLPNFKHTTFCGILKSLNFEYKARGRDSVLFDSEEIILWRKNYLKKIKSYREEGRKIYYLDETSLRTGVGESNVLGENASSGHSSKFTAAGMRKEKKNGIVLCHIGSEDGFVPNALWAAEYKHDYQDEVNEKSFEHWFSIILPMLEENAVIVLDDAPYHSRRFDEMAPTLSSSRNQIEKWLLAENVTFDEDMKKAELLKIVSRHIERYSKYVVVEMAQSQGKMVLRLPPHHFDLNPINLIWIRVKQYFARKSTTFNSASVKNLLQEALESITPEIWQTCILHVQCIEEKMWNLDKIFESDINQKKKKYNLRCKKEFNNTEGLGKLKSNKRNELSSVEEKSKFC